LDLRWRNNKIFINAPCRL